MKRMYAVSTRLDMTDGLKEYLEDYIVFYNSIERRVFHDLCHDIPKEMGMGRYITHICNSYSILKRTANSIRYDMQGRINAYLELKKTELSQISIKIQSVRKKFVKLESSMSELKPLARDNMLDKKGLSKYKNVRSSLYHQKNRLNKLCQRKSVLEQQIKYKRVSFCFGTKKLFDAQNRLDENGFKSHDGWLHTFQKKRDSGIFFLGSGDESYGNQILQLKPCEDGFLLRLRKDRPYENNGKYLLADIRFRYMEKEIISALNNNQSMTYRISRKGRKWYLTVMFSMDTDIVTDSKSGVIGIDYNNGFMELVETDSSGNMIYAEHVHLDYHGTGNKAESEIKEKISGIVKAAFEKKKNIVMEDLDFRKKKAWQNKGENAGYNRMLHLFDYHRYAFWLENLCIKYSVRLTKVNPAYTSVIGKKKYGHSRKLTIHRAAALVIARRGQGYNDKFIA